MKKAAEVLARLLDKGPAGANPFSSLFGGWQDIAGVSLAEHCRAYEVRHHSLLVEADHPGWMQLLLMQKKVIIARIRQRFPELELRDIKVRVSPGSRPESTPDFTPGSTPGSRPESTPGSSQGFAPGFTPASTPGFTPGGPASAEVEQALAAVGDPGLRERLRLLLQEMERRGSGSRDSGPARRDSGPARRDSGLTRRDSGLTPPQ